VIGWCGLDCSSVRSRKPRSKAVWTRRAAHVTSLFPQKFAITSPTIDGFPFGFVRLRTKSDGACSVGRRAVGQEARGKRREASQVRVVRATAPASGHSEDGPRESRITLNLSTSRNLLARARRAAKRPGSTFRWVYTS
jgi:hypothetical protein